MSQRFGCSFLVSESGCVLGVIAPLGVAGGNKNDF
jgi:hypothetical protein